MEYKYKVSKKDLNRAERKFKISLIIWVVCIVYVGYFIISWEDSMWSLVRDSSIVIQTLAFLSLVFSMLYGFCGLLVLLVNHDDLRQKRKPEYVENKLKEFQEAFDELAEEKQEFLESLELVNEEKKTKPRA